MPKILILDDEEIYRDELSKAAKEAGYERFMAGDGDSALEISRRERFDVVSTDLGHQGAKATEVWREARKQNPNVKVILYTSIKDPEEAKGADFYLCKRLEGSIDDYRWMLEDAKCRLPEKPE